MNERVDGLMMDRKDLKTLKRRILDDVFIKQSEKMKAKDYFMSANNDLIERKNERKNQFLEEKNKELEVHFPYCHGEAIEKQREHISQNMKEELVKNFVKNSNEEMLKQKERRERTMINKIRKEITQEKIDQMFSFGSWPSKSVAKSIKNRLENRCLWAGELTKNSLQSSFMAQPMMMYMHNA